MVGTVMRNLERHCHCTKCNNPTDKHWCIIVSPLQPSVGIHTKARRQETEVVHQRGKGDLLQRKFQPSYAQLSSVNSNDRELPWPLCDSCASCNGEIET